MAVETLKIHVGLPKCGSTTLQTAFSTSKNVLYLGRNKLEYLNTDIRVFCREIAANSDVRMLNQHHYRDVFKAAFQNTDKKTAVISDEILSPAGFATSGLGNSLLSVIENFSRVVDCKIEVLFIVREQMSYLRSYYKQLRPYDLSFNEFLSFILLRRNRWLLPQLNYANTVRRVGPTVDKLHTVPFEALFLDTRVSTRVLKELGVADVKKEFQTTHQRPQVDNEKQAELFSASRAAAENGYVPITNWVASPYEKTMIREFSHPDSATLQKSLANLNDRRTKLNQKSKALLDNPPPVLDEDVMAVDPVIENRLTGSFRRTNPALKSLVPEYDWQSLGYLM